MEPQKEPNPNYLPYPPQPQSTDDEIDLRELFKALWKGKWIIIATTSIFAIGSVLYALSLPNIYKADALLAPAESSSGGSLSKMAGQFGGLAALAGVNLGSAETSQAELAMQVMKSRKFVEGFINKHDLLVPLMATRGWEPSNDNLIIDEEVYNDDKNKWIRKEQGLRGVIPSAQEAYDVFNREVFNISKNKDSGLYRISVRHYSPYIAQQWVTWLIEDINQVMRERTIAEASKNLDYLEKQLRKTSVTDMQSMFYKLIEEQTKNLMLAEVQDEFIFKTIDPANKPELKDSPKRALICLIGMFLGVGLGIFILFIKNILGKDRK
ncbi:TPA: Wzz/FepE/Etk N-terminal domain-containing protein [Vibrio parahaemolyticus]|uniref:Wzz/FepE/Etk N-terminal domain-containing protein n=1 Tax=Vibrio parahaemolyticus TaxID=670 RepID=UPI000977224D|nr:Wzz/FepE/Etk N-terminal domain-containing protein [Vibrio parahaemolyticus]EJE4699992.1 LPS O-antigen length regulator [Vibrio parahaemolyticus]ELA9558040.1 LPS O-antigen length regulator [Vibrio parahaemolyticus]OMP50408.1 LPS O-antigen length regulator [Vibrio parahaemolyticus]